MSVNSKSEIRAYYKKLRQNLAPDKKKLLDARITDRLISLDEYKNSGVLLAFVSKDIEVDTEAIIKNALKNGKTVAVPRCESQSGVMSFYIIKSYDDLEIGYFNIPEPKVYCEKLRSFDDSLCLVPGLAYDKLGYRVGFGGGYYDRFLSGYSGVSVGMCYSDCVADELPVDEYDRKINVLVTDNKIYRKD